jgi:hypothetical protein
MVLALSACLTGCAGTTSIGGVYRLVSVEIDGQAQTVDGDGLTEGALELASGAEGEPDTFVMAIGDSMEGGTFTLDGHTVTLTGADGGEPVECSVDGSTIACVQASTTLVFTRDE